ncbi:MAG TPA: formimidoylglutamate deiminase [Gammaproteobacteria bacterium]|nr:formimidoylglutamate deiminase [Gammaproteobacteria bacterium]
MDTTLAFKYVLTPAGLRRDCRLSVDETGMITAVEPAEGPVDGYFAIPGLPNAHSHAFQRALAGHGEATSGEDSFWSWREAMYRLARRVTPEDMFVIARHAFTEMLRGGFTSVAEFHYLHHLPDGTAGADMARAVIEAARVTGIRLLLLPVLYRRGGFGQPARVEQQRFLHEKLDDYWRLLEQLRDVRLGIAPHSLRAVEPELLPRVLQEAAAILGERFPVHIHISEQQREVEECRENYGCTPIELLARTIPLDARWNLVHATHAGSTELRLIREHAATVVLCPITEAYLGDGLFAADEFVKAGGRVAIGSDSNCRIDAVEELRWLEYGQRLRQQRRARLAEREGLGRPLWQRACAGGAAALDEPVGAIEVGKRADLVVLDEEAAPWLGHDIGTLLDAFIIGGSRHDIAAVYVGGRRIVDHGTVKDDARSAREFARTVSRLNAA